MELVERHKFGRVVRVSRDEVTIHDLMQEYGVSKQTACLGRKRGWFVLRKKKMKPLPDFSEFDVTEAYRIARIVFFRSIEPFYGNCKEHMDDCVQEAVVRMVELSAIPKNGGKFNFYYSVAKSVMANYLRSVGSWGPWVNMMSWEDLQERYC